jgi:Predicted exporters of the RND superfamily
MSVVTRLRKIPVLHARIILVLTAVLATGAIFAVTRIEFDHNTLNLQSPENESVQTYLELLADSDTSPWTAITLAHGPEEAQLLAQKLENLPLVSKVVSIEDLIPDQQEEKLRIIEEMDLLLGSLSIATQTSMADTSANLAALEKFHSSLQSIQAAGIEDMNYGKPLAATAQLLKFLQGQDDAGRNALFEQLQHSLLKGFPGRLNALLAAMNAGTVTLGNLPQEIRDRWVNHDVYRLEISPAENLMDNHAMQRFVRQLKAELTQVSGSPVVAIEAGDAVIKAFRQAFIYALLATCLLLLILTDKPMDTLYILAPLSLAAIFTGAISVLLDLKLNFANIIALPLLIALGIDSAIYILNSLRHATKTDADVLANSSSLAVILSALTTIFSIGNLAFSPHAGTASMGKILTIGLVMTLICTLIILPSLLAKQMSNLKINEP